MPDPTERAVLSDRCVAALVPQAAIDAAVLAASKPVHDDGHTDCYYAGILLAAWPALNGDVDRLRADADQGAPDAMLALERSLTDDKVATLEADNERLREERDGLRDVIENAMAALRMALACDETEGTT